VMGGVLCRFHAAAGEDVPDLDMYYGPQSWTHSQPQ
jgi:hypothetical protein